MNKNKVLIASIILVIDQITKIIVSLYNIHINIIPSFLYISYHQNYGAAWSILEGKTILLIIASLVSIIIIFNITYSYKETKISNLCFGLLYGGTLGNLVDRVFYGYVRDFISIKIMNYNYPIFNLADASLVIGVIILVIITIKGDVVNGKSRSRKKNR